MVSGKAVGPSMHDEWSGQLVPLVAVAVNGAVGEPTTLRALSIHIKLTKRLQPVTTPLGITHLPPCNFLNPNLHQGVISWIEDNDIMSDLSKLILSKHYLHRSVGDLDR